MTLFPIPFFLLAIAGGCHSPQPVTPTTTTVIAPSPAPETTTNIQQLVPPLPTPTPIPTPFSQKPHLSGKKGLNPFPATPQYQSGQSFVDFANKCLFAIESAQTPAHAAQMSIDFQLMETELEKRYQSSRLTGRNNPEVIAYMSGLYGSLSEFAAKHALYLDGQVSELVYPSESRGFRTQIRVLARHIENRRHQ